MTKRCSWLAVLLVAAVWPGGSAAQRANGLGVEASGPTSGVPELEHWSPFVGEWHITFEALDSAGIVQASFGGEWNFHYVAGGAAIQDAFFLPPRDVALDPPATRFVGTALRVFDPAAKRWYALWTDSGAGGPEAWVGTSEPGRITFERTEAGRTTRVDYSVSPAGAFRWEQRERSENGPYVLTQRATGHRR